MNRDCGIGKLIPHEFEVVSCQGQNDKEREQSYVTLEFALSAYNAQISILKDTPCSNVRLYAKDKEGYCNCIKSWIHCADGSITQTDRLSEL